MSLCNIPLLTSSFELLHGFTQILCGSSLGGPLPSLLKSGCYPYFSWNYGQFSAIFGQFFKKSDQKSFIFEGSPGDLISSLFKLGRCDLHLRF